VDTQIADRRGDIRLDSFIVQPCNRMRSLAMRFDTRAAYVALTSLIAHTRRFAIAYVG